jgi:ProP effector
MTTDEIRAAIALLAETFPNCFAVWEQRRQPLKVGVHKDVLARLDGAMTPVELANALRAYVANPVYRRQLLAGAWRYDLDGNVAGTVTAAEEGDARRKVADIRAKAAARKQSGNGKQPPAAKTAEPKRDGLTDLKAAAQRRKTEAANAA